MRHPVVCVVNRWQSKGLRRRVANGRCPPQWQELSWKNTHENLLGFDPASQGKNVGRDPTHRHGTSEQFHSELKSDLDLERLPSGKFATNALVLSLGLAAYNVLRLCGQTALAENDALPKERKIPVAKPMSRRRLRSAIQELMYFAARLAPSDKKHQTAIGGIGATVDRFTQGGNRCRPEWNSTFDTCVDSRLIQPSIFQV